MGRPAKTSDAQPLSEPRVNELYWRDSYSWALEQADALRRRDFDAVDWENVIEEIEDRRSPAHKPVCAHHAALIEDPVPTSLKNGSCFRLETIYSIRPY